MAKMLFVGDLIVHNDTQKLVSDELHEYIREHAIASCNLEGPIGGHGTPLPKVGPHLSQIRSAASNIEAAGFNLINASNNHIGDFGMEAIKETIKAFSEFDLIGIGENFNQAYELKLKVVEGRRFGFLSFSEWGFGAADDDTKGGFAWVNHPAVNSIVRNARSGVDILIVQVHAGVEEVSIPLPEWRARYRELIDLGATAVIAHHPHEVQGVESYGRGKIFYSLGNFSLVSKTNAPPGSHGAALSLTFENSSLTDWKLVPLICTAGTVSIDHRTEASSYIKSLHQQLAEQYEESINLLVVRLWEDRYRHFYQRSLGGFRSLRGFGKTILNVTSGETINYTLLSHNLNIESHRFVAQRAAKLLSHTT